MSEVQQKNKKEKVERPVLVGERELPKRKARSNPGINYSNSGLSIQARMKRAANGLQKSASKRKADDSSSEEQVDQIDPELVRNTTLTIFSKYAMDASLLQIARKNAAKTVKVIEDRFLDESVSSSEEESQDNDNNSSDSSEISTYELPKEPTMPPFKASKEEQQKLQKYRSYQSEIAEDIVEEAFGKAKEGKDFPKLPFERAAAKGSGEKPTPSKRRKI